MSYCAAHTRFPIGPCHGTAQFSAFFARLQHQKLQWPSRRSRHRLSLPRARRPVTVSRLRPRVPSFQNGDGPALRTPASNGSSRLSCCMRTSWRNLRRYVASNFTVNFVWTASNHRLWGRSEVFNHSRTKPLPLIAMGCSRPHFWHPQPRATVFCGTGRTC